MSDRAAALNLHLLPEPADIARPEDAETVEDARVVALEPLELLDGEAGTPAYRYVGPRRRRSPDTEALYARARTLWPGLDARALNRCAGDPRRVARLVARRTVLTEEAILRLLERRP
ncbi:MAG: hypothetical protein U0838_11770 [Chloroflexota bacterium]